MGLGTGDLAIPLTFLVSTLHAYGIGYAIPTMLGGLLGLTTLFYYIQGKKNTVLPALPPITAGLLLGYTITWIALG
jgi:presenilin-like A22 family membrane protease